MHLLNILLILTLVGKSRSADYHEFINQQRSNRFHYVITAPEFFTVGENNKVAIDIEGRSTSTLVHITLRKWHGGKLLASAAKLMMISQSPSPFILTLKVNDDSYDKFALLVIRFLGNQYNQKEVLVKLQKKKLKIFIKTNKGIYKPDEPIKVWVMVLDFNVCPLRGKINSVMLKHRNGQVADYKRDLELKRGIATFELTSMNLQAEGKAELTVHVQNQVASAIIFIGNHGYKQLIANGLDDCSDCRRIKSKSSITIFNRDFNQFTIPALFENFENRILESAKEILYSASRSFIEIFLASNTLMPETIEEFAIVYNKPVDGLNRFSYQLICNENILISKKYEDLYSSTACTDSLLLSHSRSRTGGDLATLCKQGKTRFSINIKITRDMAPKCRILVYRVSSTGELIAADKEFRIHYQLPTQLHVTVDKKVLFTGQSMNVQVHASGDRTLLISGLHLTNANRNIDEEDLNEQNILNFCQNRTIPIEVLTISKSCNGQRYITAGQCFRNSRLKIITDLDADPDIPCAGVRRQGIRSLRRRGILHKPVIGSDVSDWIWKNIELGRDKRIWNSTFVAPKTPGKYKIEVISVDDHCKLNVARNIIIEVKPKPGWKEFSEKNRCLLQKCKGAVKNMPIISLQIFPSLDKKIFLLRRCQSLKMKLCVRNAGELYARNRKYFEVVQLNMVPGFMLAEDDLNRLLKKRKRRLVSFFILSNQVYLYMKKIVKKTCFLLRLKQTGGFRYSHNSATVVHYSSEDRDKKTTIRYWITEKDCSRRR